MSVHRPHAAQEFELKTLMKQMMPSSSAKDPFLEWVQSKCAPRGCAMLMAGRSC